MLPKRIDWRSEIAAISPFLEGKNGVIHIKFENEECAPNHFSTILKNMFSDYGDNRFSIRIDHDFSTTHVAHDILTEFQAQLERLQVEVETPDLPRSINILADMEAGENIGISVGSISVNSDPHHALLRQRIVTICSALDQFVANGGRFMIEHRDASISWQRMFLKDVWEPMLSKFADNGLAYIQMLGPECGQEPHEDAPRPDVTRVLPTGFETDEARENDAYDDLVDIFEAEGHSREAAIAAASAHLQNNLGSVSQMHNKLAGVLLSMKQRQAG